MYIRKDTSIILLISMSQRRTISGSYILLLYYQFYGSWPNITVWQLFDPGDATVSRVIDGQGRSHPATDNCYDHPDDDFVRRCLYLLYVFFTSYSLPLLLDGHLVFSLSLSYRSWHLFDLDASRQLFPKEFQFSPLKKRNFTWSGVLIFLKIYLPWCAQKI